MSNPSVHINPRFRKVHINPNFLPKDRPSTTAPAQTQPAMPTNIFINPKFLNKQPSEMMALNEHIVHQQVDADPTNTITSYTEYDQQQHTFSAPPIERQKYPQNQIITQTNRKLVRKPVIAQSQPSSSSSRSQVMLQTHTTSHSSSPLLRIGMRKLVRRGLVTTNQAAASIRQTATPTSKVVPRVRIDEPAANRYRLRNIANVHSVFCSTARTASASPLNRYKFDRRKIVASDRGLQPNTSVILTKHKLLRIGQSQQNIVQQSPAQHLQPGYLNINGVFYKSSKNKLRRQVQHTPLAGANSAASSPASAQTLSLIVRGTKYTVSSDFKRLQRSSDAPTSGLSAASGRNARLNIGHLTYKQVAPGTFERTDGHRTRDHLTAARQKSIQLLLNAGSRTKSNMPCLIYQRLGKCRALERGRCVRVHDPKRVAICPKFLQGNCSLAGCLLSHAVTLAKMPTCKFYLAGICVRDDCPYLHKKLNDRTDICPDFVRGFCERADQCNKRHEFHCPDYDATGACGKIRCPYPHQKGKPKTSRKRTATDVAEGKPSDRSGSEVSTSSANVKKGRYTTAKVDSHECAIENSGVSESQASASVDDVLVLIPSRPKLGSLPSYIPF